MEIERGHITIAIGLIRKLAMKHPRQVFMNAHGNDLAGPKLIAYLTEREAQGKRYVSDCPQSETDGSCGCFN